jgi:hypothetical protein
MAKNLLKNLEKAEKNNAGHDKSFFKRIMDVYGGVINYFRIQYEIPLGYMKEKNLV